MTRYLWIAIAVTSWAAAGAHAQLGSPSDVNSCYSHCGEERTSGGVATCYCDLACEQRGDCCLDVNTYCAVQGAAPHCALTNNSPGAGSEFGTFCGTDLGFTFAHSGTVNVLFGDSWQYASDGVTCEDRGSLPFPAENDDAQGRLPLARPAWLPLHPAVPGASPSTCPTGTLTMNMSGSTFAPMTLNDVSNNPVSLAVANTPLTGFSDGTNAWGVFGVGAPETNRDVYIAFRTGTNAYRARVKLGPGGNFQNVGAAVVTSLTNFAQPASNGTLLLFGRPKFNLVYNDPASNGVYLLRQTLPINTSGAVNWSPMYYQSTSADGTVNWTSNPALATSIIGTDFKLTSQLDVKWIPQIKKWVMLYGGSMPDSLGLNGTTTDQPRHGAIHMRIADFPWGPWSPPAPALFREDMGPYYECDATGFTDPTGCDIATWPTGTWTQEYGSSGAVPNCLETNPQPNMPNYIHCFPGLFAQRGNLYSPNIITPWTYDGGFEPVFRIRQASLYFLTSTWTPYQVTLNVLDMRVFDQTTYSFGNVLAQLRDTSMGMVNRSSTTATTRSAGSSTGYGTSRSKFSVVFAGTGGSPNRTPQIGDTVAFSNNFSGGARYLTRSGAGISYVAESSPIPAAAKWVLESTNTTAYPNGTPIVWGQTPFRLKSPTSSDRLRSVSGTLSVSSSAPNDTFKWKFYWNCVSGDNCVDAMP